MDLGSLIAAYIAVAGGHTLGHLSTANQTGAPASIEPQTMSEIWKRPISEATPDRKSWKRLPVETERNGAGFIGQDTVAHAMNTKEGNLANALYKGAYLAGGSALGGTTGYRNGDIGGISHNSGVHSDKIKAMIGATLADDLRRAMGYGSQNFSLGFGVLGGEAPGLIGTYRW